MTTQLYLHTDKTVICLQGDNPADFLNDLLTAQIEQLEQRHCQSGLPAQPARAHPV